ncbi:MAG: DUF115 domain-containing protein [Treponema sp.]|nr:DUF115 domain-containing protein [Treponema sp.]
MIYSGTVKSKNGDDIPLFASGKPMHSKYNPENEGDSFASSIKSGGSAFIIIAGVGAGFHIKSVAKKFPNAFLLAVEADRESLEFCKNFPAVKDMLSKKNISLCTADQASRLVREGYIPSLYGDCVFVCQRAWENENQNLLSSLKDQVMDELKAISRDYSVQAHFGGQWQRNILANLSKFRKNPDIRLNSKLKAAVIAAGPSLDESIKRLLQHRNSYCIISTDTALGSLARSGICPDAVVSIDAQRVSATHFFALPLLKEKSALCVFDISSNRNAVEYARSQGFEVYFVRSAHPLTSLALEGTTVPLAESGSGTVTIAACDFARQQGFSEIELFGADFCYSEGKPYAKGTYLEPNFLSGCSRTQTSEQMNAALMFRTELIKSPGPAAFSGSLNKAFTTQVMEGYARTTMEWAEKWGYSKSGASLKSSAKADSFPRKEKEFNFPSFYDDYLKNLQNTLDGKGQILNPYTVSLLPLIANLRKKQNDSAKHSFFDFLKLAYSQLTRYTVLYEQ